MGIKEIIYNTISNSEKYNSLTFNTLSKQIELNGEKIKDTDIIEMCVDIKGCLPKEVFKQSLFTPKVIKSFINQYAEDHSYCPDIKKSEWFSRINTNSKGEILKTFENVINFIKYYPKFKGKLNYNEFMCYENFEDKIIDDADILKFRLKVEQELGFDTPEKVEAAVKYVCHENSFNPFKEAIEGIFWDGEKRMDDFFIKYLGVEDNKFNRSFTRKWFYALMKRLYEPGCAFDCMLIVYDKTQGTGKSKIVECLIDSLGIKYGYDQTITCDNKDKDNVDKLNKAWIVGIDEMNDFLKKNPEQTKQFLSQSRDQARLSYARRSETYYRHCVFYGNSNLEYFLKDYTDGFERRYWVMDAHGEKHDSNWWSENMPAEYCRQVLAEAKYFYDNNPNFVYNVLDIEETEWLKQVQYKHKTLNNDDLLQEDIYAVLNMDYTYDVVYDGYEKWKNYVKSHINSDTVDALSTDDILSDNTTAYKLDYIEVKWLKRYVKEELKRDISTQYLTALISLEWEYDKQRYNSNKTKNVYRRI